MNEQTAMQQLLNQIIEERTKLPLPIGWDRAYQAIEMMIKITYIPLEKEQIVKAWMATDNELQRLAAEQYYEQTYGGNK
jgi:hypothetical protein